ncbi:uncharacterized protein LOC117605633 [Osmia lignaria lignaria]|uniref:uncharacterized protein LOC117605633 n=1 Tax=Osmia lignaria lignaria TaxID=1437193 RepID=UPI00402BD1CB
MSTTKLKITSVFDQAFKQLLSFAWRKLLAAVLTLGITVFVIWLRYKLLSSNSEATKNILWKQNLPHVPQTSNNTIQQRITSYCQSRDCKSISCSSIPKSLDPGTEASNFIETDFKIDCKNVEIIKLSFNDCKFPENKLRRNWLSTNVSIDELTFQSCSLDEIEDDIFSDSIYKSTKKIIMISNQLHSLRRGMFHHLESLNELTIQNNTIRFAEFNLLADVANSLNVLELSGAINNRETLRNITGGSVPMSKLLILSLRENSIGTIERELFIGVPSVTSLYLDNSKVETVAQDTLEPMASSIIQLFLNSNNIVTLPEGLFDSIIKFRQAFHLTATDNPWHCNCSLKWIQDHVGTSSSIVIGSPICKTPEINAGKSFTKANFCYQSNTTSSVPPVTSTESTKSTKHDRSSTTTLTTKPTKEIINLTCNFASIFLQSGIRLRKLMSNDFLQIRSQFPHFYISRDLDQGVLVNLPDLDQPVTLLWFNNDDVENSLSCVKNVKHSYLVQNIDPQTTYTICLLDDNENTVSSPLNCLAVTTSPTYEYRTWLTNANKSLVFCVSIFSLIVLFLMGAVIALLMVRRHPILLRGSKRLMFVKRRNVDAIVLPKGIDIDEEKPRNNVSFDQKFHEDEYITPLPPASIPVPRRSRVSRISVQSDWHSYVSQIEPNDTPLEYWRFARLNSELEKPKSEAPPLPPHRKNAVPSLSMAVESNGDGYYPSV